MAQITYQLIQKPIEQRIIDAACIYWNVERSYFSKGDRRKENTIVTLRRNIIFYLIKQFSDYPVTELPKLFGFSTHGFISEGISSIDAQKRILKQLRDDINQISHLADKLDADFITTDVRLVNNKIEKL
jgi:chromosomal replication initiation ATPase DnaA